MAEMESRFPRSRVPAFHFHQPGTHSGWVGCLRCDGGFLVHPRQWMVSHAMSPAELKLEDHNNSHSSPCLFHFTVGCTRSAPCPRGTRSRCYAVPPCLHHPALSRQFRRLLFIPNVSDTAPRMVEVWETPMGLAIFGHDHAHGPDMFQHILAPEDTEFALVRVVARCCSRPAPRGDDPRCGSQGRALVVAR